MAHTIIASEEMLNFLTHVEQREGGANGWEQPPALYDITLDTTRTPASLTFTELGPWHWTAFFFGLGPNGATGDVDHDLGLYADRVDPLPHFLATVLRYGTPANDMSRARRTLIAVDERARLYRVTSVDGDSTMTAEQLTRFEEDPHLAALAKVADALRGGPAVHEYAFEVKLFAVAQVRATNEEEARQLISSFQSVDIDHSHNGVTVTEVSSDDGVPDLIEIDGEAPS
ncbi:hypothetical protein GCM10009733_008350 [Nonomuraea maheshkhaliensis]|uniref:Suppressor of fused protein (SUFU) n=1 Tax=Nonomuraea maheshkhaliensis TaxID=419590 RepID=A0ABN2ER96_9ACTN